MQAKCNNKSEFESQIEIILLERFCSKLDKDIGSKLDTLYSIDIQRTYEAASLLVTMSLISGFNKADSEIRSRAIIARTKLVLDRMMDMHEKGEISLPIYQTCSQELNTLINE